MVSHGIFVRNVKHLKKEPKIFDVIGIVIIMDGKPEHGMRGRIAVSHYPIIQPRGNQNRTLKATRPLGRHEPEIVIPLHILLLKLIELLYAVDSELLHFFSEVVGGELRDVAFGGLAVAVGRNEVVGFGAEDFVKTEGEVGHSSGGNLLRGHAATGRDDGSEKFI